MWKTRALRAAIFCLVGAAKRVGWTTAAEASKPRADALGALLARHRRARQDVVRDRVELVRRQQPLLLERPRLHPDEDLGRLLFVRGPQPHLVEPDEHRVEPASLAEDDLRAGLADELGAERERLRQVLFADV